MSSAKCQQTQCVASVVPGRIAIAAFCLLALVSGQTRPVRAADPVSTASVISVLHLGREIITSIMETWDLVDEVGDVHLPYKRGNDKKILKQMYMISQQIENSEHQILNNAQLTVDILLKQLMFEFRLENYLQELADLMNRVSHREQIMRSYVESEEKIEQLTLESFASSTVALDVNSIPLLLARIDLLVSGSRDLPFKKPGILELLLQNTEEAKSTICSFGVSAQQVLYQLYNAISITELKGYSMMQFSWMLLKAYGKGNFTAESRLMRRRFEDRTSRTQQLLQRVMQQASRDYWRCDPERNQQKEGETFLQITRLLQGYVENEVDMNTENTCKENCAHYSWGVKQEQCYKDLYCSKQPKCSGRIYNCEYMDSDMWICPSATSSNRRYEYIEYENGVILGQKGHCPRGTTKVDSWWRWLFWHCSYCMCLCDDAGPRSDRYINMRESVSDVMNNKIVTGMRFVKKNRIIHLIVQQGTLLPRGLIDNTTLEWVEAEGYNILSPNVRNGQDYHTLNHDNRILDLDDLEVQPSYVLTGVRFRLLGNHLNMEIRMTEMDFGTGKLVDPDKSIWIGSDKTEHSEEKRTEVKLDRPHVPLLTPSKSIPDSESNQFIRFRESDRGMDAAQTTVPFFDAQPVVPAKPIPLAGAGLFHKGRPKFGGFIAPKVLTYDFGPHVQPPASQIPPESEERQLPRQR
ncbi:uncharacterized protein LOC129763220 isoform X1 [Toxorhynchites rutilus septentrionalis]|uniref:uncharacterized protein LOC129763220 isoform X1 n=1 Tax=Toxorhynchites rutilus septentrionalis TaxID=329112 RepID=UPI0024785BC8|nr:uncharacterized protein LOC129763220 isoform X1 [Toxorhynchites rutilus septentrionalis]